MRSMLTKPNVTGGKRISIYNAMLGIHAELKGPTCSFCGEEADLCYPVREGESVRAAMRDAAKRMVEDGWRQMACENCQSEGLGCPDCVKGHRAECREGA